jgi:hypothetical protein
MFASITSSFRTIAALFLGCVGLSIPAQAGTVSFFVPESHEKYVLIDSLFTALSAHEGTLQQLETRTIKRKDIRAGELEEKAQYLEYALQNRLADSTLVRSYCAALQQCQNDRMRYLDELLSVLEGDNRAQCFVLWRKCRDMLALANEMVSKYELVESPAPVIHYGRNALATETASDQVMAE